jgi:hypothetical protein
MTIDGTTTNKEIKWQWSRELAEDLKHYHSIDVEQELIQLLKYQRAENRKNQIRKIFELKQT